MMMTKEEKKSVLIIANGEPPRDEQLQNLVNQSDLIIAADGGSNLCFQKNIYPDFIIGDLDSIQQHVLAHFKDCEIIKVPDQDSHDLAKALDLAKTLQPDIIRIVAAFGKRLDHSLANLVLIQNSFSETPLEFHDSFGRLMMISGNNTLSVPVGQIVSLFSFLPITGLFLTGFKYSLQNRDYPEGFNGLSNVVNQETVQIKIKEGSLFLYITNEFYKS